MHKCFFFFCLFCFLHTFWIAINGGRCFWVQMVLFSIGQQGLTGTCQPAKPWAGLYTSNACRQKGHSVVWACIQLKWFWPPSIKTLSWCKRCPCRFYVYSVSLINCWQCFHLSFTCAAAAKSMTCTCTFVCVCVCVCERDTWEILQSITRRLRGFRKHFHRGASYF